MNPVLLKLNDHILELKSLDMERKRIKQNNVFALNVPHQHQHRSLETQLLQKERNLLKEQARYFENVAMKLS